MSFFTAFKKISACMLNKMFHSSHHMLCLHLLIKSKSCIGAFWIFFSSLKRRGLVRIFSSKLVRLTTLGKFPQNPRVLDDHIQNSTRVPRWILCLPCTHCTFCLTRIIFLLHLTTAQRAKQMHTRKQRSGRPSSRPSCCNSNWTAVFIL